MTVDRLRVHFRRFRKKAKLSEKFVVHSLRHSFATDMIERCCSVNGKIESKKNEKIKYIVMVNEKIPRERYK